MFVVNGDANYLTGNIIYDGSVRVKGNVEDDVIIDAKGDVIVEGYVQGAYVSSGNNVVVVGGVNAGDKGYIAAQKTVYGDYFENANVYAYENVEANYIMNSQINAGVLVKAKGMICGGNVISGFKIIARSFGNKAHTRTILCAAAGRKFEQRLDDENIMRVHVEKDIETLTLGQQKLIQTIPADKLANNDIYIKVGIALRMKNETLSSIMGEIKVLQNRISDIKNASISALDTVYPNTTIIINSIARNIVDEIDNVTFYQRDQSVLTKKFSR